MKKTHLKLFISLFLVALFALGMMIPTYGVDREQAVYSFHNVQNGENLDGKHFLVVSSYELDLSQDNFPGAIRLQSNSPKSIKEGGPFGNFKYSPIIIPDSYYNGEYECLEYDIATKLDGYCSGYEEYEWKFEKNSDGTYSLFVEGYGDRYYLCGAGANAGLTVTPAYKGHYEIEYKDGGKIALKLMSYEVLNEEKGGQPPIDDNYRYVVYSNEGNSFISGSSSGEYIFELYEENPSGIVFYDYWEGMYPGELGNEPEMDTPIQIVGKEEQSLSDVKNTSKNGTFYVYTEAEETYLEDLFAKGEEDSESFKDPSSKSSKIWGREVALAGWSTRTIRNEDVILNLDAKLKYDASTGTIKTTDAKGNDVALPSPARLESIYVLRSENIFFNIRYTTELNLNDGSLITEDVNTESLAVGHVYYPMPNMAEYMFAIIKDPKKGPSRGPVNDDEDIISNYSKLLTTTYNPSKNEIQIVIEGFMEVDPVTNERISYTPVTGKSIDDITNHIIDYITKYSDELNVQDSENINDLDIVWYDNDDTPIGVMVRGVMRDMKNFLYIDATFEDIPEEDIPVDDFKIEILNSENEVLKTLTLKDDNVEVSADKKSYTWKINDMTENTYTLKQFNRKSGSYTSTTSASSDSNTNMGDLNDDSDLDVVTLQVSTANNKKDRVSLVNKYVAPASEGGNNSPEQPAGGASNAGGGAPAPAGGPVAQAVQSIYNGLLPKTGSASAFIITVVGIVIIVVAIRLRNTDNKKEKKDKNK